MKIPFLKNSKRPRIAQEPSPEKLIQGSESDHIEHHCMQELFDSAPNKDVKRFRSALEALVMNCFEWGEDAT